LISRRQRGWSRSGEVQAPIAAGRRKLFNLIKGIPRTLKFEPGKIVAESDPVIWAQARVWIGDVQKWSSPQR
jgi:hypothetical protein